MQEHNAIFFPPGSEWIYLKIYCGEYISDILIGKFFNLSIELIKKKMINKWFFVRYYDPKFHLRVRLYLCDVAKLNVILSVINEKISEEVQNLSIESIQLCTYKREMDRYGGHLSSMEISEHVFFSESMTIGNLLYNIKDDVEKEKLRWLFGLVSINRMLDDFHFSLKEKMIFMETVSKFYLTDFNKGKYLNNQIEKIFREYESVLRDLLDKDSNALFSRLINQRFILYQSDISMIVANIQNKVINKNIRDLVSSYIHMSCNRLFRIDVRKQEYIIYCLLLRFYKKKYYTS